MKTPSLAPCHPMQPLVMKEGVVRFKPNHVVKALLAMASGYGLSLNQITKDTYLPEDIAQLYQLIGSSVSHLGDIDDVPRTTVAEADRESERFLAERAGNKVSVPLGYFLLVHYSPDLKNPEDPSLDLIPLDVDSRTPDPDGAAMEAALEALLEEESPIERLESAEVILAGREVDLEEVSRRQSAKAQALAEAASRDRHLPRRWRDQEGRQGVYFPGTDLNVGQNGGRGTGMPQDVEWLDPIDDIPWAKDKAKS